MFNSTPHRYTLLQLDIPALTALSQDTAINLDTSITRSCVILQFQN